MLTSPTPHSLERRSGGFGTLTTLMVLLLLMGMAAMLSARVLHGELMGSEALVQGHQRQSLQESGLDWGLQLLNSPALAGSCEPSGGPGPAFAEGLTDTDDRGHRRVREPWQGRPFICSSDEDERWHCTCPGATPSAPGSSAASRSYTRAGSGAMPGVAPGIAPSAAVYADRLPRFSLEFQGKERVDAAAWRRRTLRLLVQSCAEGQASCELPGTPASRPLPTRAQSQLVVLASALAQAPASALTSAGAVNLSALADEQSGLALPPDQDSAWVLQAGAEVTGADGHVQGPPGSAGASLVRSMAADLALPPEHFFQRFFGLPPEAYRRRAGLSILDCRGSEDCSAALAARVRSGQAWLWIQGPLRLRSPLKLGSSDSPVLIICEEPLELAAGLQLTGLLYSHGALRLEPAAGLVRIEGALISAAASTLAGRVQVVHSAPVLRRLADLRGSWVRLPGGWTP